MPFLQHADGKTTLRFVCVGLVVTLYSRIDVGAGTGLVTISRQGFSNPSKAVATFTWAVNRYLFVLPDIL
jgi:hypothetical protein